MTHIFNSVVGKITLKRDGHLDLIKFLFSGSTDDEFKQIVQANIPAGIEYDIKVGIASGGGSAMSGGWVTAAIRLTFKNQEDLKKVRRHFKTLQAAQ